MALSRKEIEELKPRIERVVESILGFNEPTLVTAAINCLDKGYSKRDAAEKLGGKGGILEYSQAAKFAEQLFNVYDTFHSTGGREKSKKRKPTDDRRYEENDSKRSRRADDDSAPIPEPGTPSPGQLTADKIKEMMASARLTIQERKAQLSVVMPSMTTPSASLIEAQQRQMAEELQSRIQTNMAKVGMTAANPVLAMSGPMPVILDEEGRTIDAKTGQAIQLQHHTPTLKANIRAKKREQFKAVHERPPEEISESKFFDSRLSLKGAMRSKRSFKFHDKGKFEQLAQRLRNAAQLEKLQSEIAQVAKKTGIASAAKFATIQPKSNQAVDEVPDVEWWDSLILKSDSYSSEIDSDRITELVEHPIQMKPPAEPAETVKIAVMLTKKERKKLRRQNRTEAQKEEQEKIRLGLMPPPEPKVRMANLMRVLGTEAVQDPTKVEAHVRAQMAKRQRAHEEANASRKLTKDQRREKKMKKIKEDTSLGVHVTVYRIRDLMNPAKKFKVETNAKQLFMTGIVVLHKECNVIVVEGGPKQQKKFNKLVMHRMKWTEEQQHLNDDDDDEDEKEAEKINYCKVVWEGTVKKRSFGEMMFKMCPMESFAREQFKKHGVEQYWDLAYNSYILETATDES